MATRNILTSVRPMISGPWTFCVSNYNLSVNFILQKIIYGDVSRKFGESLAETWRKKAFP